MKPRNYVLTLVLNFNAEDDAVASMEAAELAASITDPKDGRQLESLMLQPKRADPFASFDPMKAVQIIADLNRPPGDEWKK